MVVEGKVRVIQLVLSATTHKIRERTVCVLLADTRQTWRLHTFLGVSFSMSISLSLSPFFLFLSYSVYLLSVLSLLLSLAFSVSFSGCASFAFFSVCLSVYVSVNSSSPPLRSHLFFSLLPHVALCGNANSGRGDKKRMFAVSGD